MSQTPVKVTLAKGSAINTIRHIKYDTAAKQLEAICFVNSDDARARFVTGNGRTSAAFLKLEPNDLEPFLAEVFAAFPPDSFERLENDPIVSYRRAIPADKTVAPHKKPQHSKKGFGPRHRYPYGP